MIEAVKSIYHESPDIFIHIFKTFVMYKIKSYFSKNFSKIKFTGFTILFHFIFTFIFYSYSELINSAVT